MSLSQHYKSLGLPPESNLEEVKRAFRNLAMKHHPDKGGNELEFRKISEAYQTISKYLESPHNKSHQSQNKEKYFEIKNLNTEQYRSILNVLVYFSSIDGNISLNEIKIINKFIEQYRFKVNLEDFINKTVTRISKKDHSDFLDVLYKDLDKLEHLAPTDKHKIISLLNLLVYSDGEKSPEEEWMMSLVLAYWRISGEGEAKKKEENSVFIYPDSPILFENLNITVGNLQKLFEMGYTTVVFFEVFSAIIYSQKKSSKIWLIPPKIYPLKEIIGPTFFTLIFGWWSIWGFFFTISSLFINIIGGKDLSNEVAKQNNIKYSPEWKQKNKGGEKFLFVLGVIISILYLIILASNNTTSGSYDTNSQNYNTEKQLPSNGNSYHTEKCGLGKCELNGKCYILPENAICEDGLSIERQDAWKCITDSIEYNGICYNSRFENGKIISKNSGYFNGGHEITINNQGGNSDALVKIVDQSNNKAIISFYVRQGYNFTIKNIRNGNYNVYFKYFDYKNGILESRGAQKMERTGELYSSVEGNYISFATWEITIYPVTNGNAQTDDVSGDVFDNL